MRDHIFLPILLVLCLLAVAACSKDDPVQESWEVTAVLTPTGLGDLGYNDQMYLGLCYIREQLGCEVIDRFPSSVDEGVAMAKAWMQETAVEGKHRLLILCEEGYEAAVRETGWENSEDNCILQLECNDEDLPVYTRCMPLYGACYVVGRLCKETLAGSDKHAALVLANPYDMAITEGKEGFVQGTSESGIDVDLYYMAQEESIGYDNNVELYHLCYDLAPQCGFILPLAGGSNKGVYQYGREEHNDYIWTCALDSDLAYTSKSAAYGIMKYIDQLLLDFARNWKSGLPNEKHGVCGLASGYLKVEVNPYVENSWGTNLDSYVKEAIEKENEKYDNK